MVSYWTKECGRQNTKDTSKLTGSPVSIDTLYQSAEIAGGAVDSVVKK